MHGPSVTVPHTVSGRSGAGFLGAGLATTAVAARTPRMRVLVNTIFSAGKDCGGV